MTFPGDVNDQLTTDGLDLRTTQDYTIEAVNGKKIDLKGDVRINGVNVITEDELDTALVPYDARLDDLEETLSYRYVKNYGAVGNGIADDTAAINAAIAAVVADGGGTVQFFSGNFKITSAITVPHGVNFWGVGSGWVFNQSTHGSRIVCSTAAAKINVEGSGSTFGNLVIDGDNVATGPLLYRKLGAERTFLSMYVNNSAGIGIQIDEAQNDHWQNVQSDNHDTACLILDKGAGGQVFKTCEFSTTPGWHLIIKETTGTGPFGTSGPSYNEWDHCLFEYGPAGGGNLLGCIDIKGGIENTFKDCACSSTSYGATVALIRQNIVAPAVAAYTYMERCWWSGTLTPLGSGIGIHQLAGTIDIHGSIHPQELNYLWKIDGGIVSIQGKILNITGLPLRDPASLLSLDSFKTNFNRPIWIEFLNPAESFAFVLTRAGDVHTPFYISPAGVINIGSGAAPADVQLSRALAGYLALGSGQSFIAPSSWCGDFSNPGFFGFFFKNADDVAAPAANQFKFYTKDDGTGKAQLCFRAPTGNPQVIATEADLNTYSGAAVTAALTDSGSYLRLTNAAPVYTLPLNATVAFPIGTVIEGVGTIAPVTIAATGGVTINSAGSLVVPQDAKWSLKKVGTNEWDLSKEVKHDVLNGSTTWDPVSLAVGAMTSTTVTVTGAALGDFVLASFSLALAAGMQMTANVTAADTVTVTLVNHTAGIVDVASGTLRARVMKV